MAASRTDRVTIMITSPLEDEHAATIAAAYPDRVEVIHRPDLIAPARYGADHDGDPTFTRSPDQEAEWRSLLGRAEVLWDFPKGVPGHPLDYAPALKWVQTTSAGVGQAVKRLGVQDNELIITTASGIHAQPLAEFVIGTLLYHHRQFGRLLSEQREHHWERYCSRGLAGQTMAIVGPGRIGREIARIARSFRMRVWAMGRVNDPARAADLGVDRLFAREDLHEMLAEADCVVLSAPHTPETEDMIGSAEFDAIKPGAVLINIARGAMVDESALLSALESGQISFAGLDVFRTEPLPPDAPFWDLPNVLVSPHSASTIDTENAELVEVFVRNLGHYLEGDTASMQPKLNIARLY